MDLVVVDGLWHMKFDLVATLALVALLLVMGFAITKKIKVLQKYCIPAPVVGGFWSCLLRGLDTATNFIKSVLIIACSLFSCWLFLLPLAWGRVLVY